jgi:hypothetical protein
MHFVAGATGATGGAAAKLVAATTSAAGMSEAIYELLLVPIPASRFAHAGYSLPRLPADLPAAQAQVAARGCDPLARRANQQKPVQPLSKKYSA